MLRHEKEVRHALHCMNAALRGATARQEPLGMAFATSIIEVLKWTLCQESRFEQFMEPPPPGTTFSEESEPEPDVH